MFMKTDPAVEAYLAEAQSWDEDRRLLLDRSNRRAWHVAGVAVIVTMLAVAAMLVLTPLKTVVPYVIRVDNSTGIVDVVPTDAGTVPAAEAVTRYLISHYVSARERYVGALAESDYELVGSFNTAPMNQAWFAAWDPRNAESPLNRYKDGTTVRVQIQAISFLARRSGERDVAQVRVLTATRPGGTGAEQVQRWIVTLTYAYAGPAKDNQQRSLNPLGLRVTEYRKEPEVAAAVAASSGS
jgi:type IV secretion system protein VirB8